MAKRKRRAGDGAKLHAVVDYQDERYVPYLHSAETGILEAWTIEPDIRDGDVREVLRGLMRAVKKSGQLPAPLTADEPSPSSSAGVPGLKEISSGGSKLIEIRLYSRLREAFQTYGVLTPEELIGILSVINNSVGAWNRGMRGQEYLKYIKDFLGLTGVTVRELSEDEVEMLGLDLDDDDDEHTIKGDYREIS